MFLGIDIGTSGVKTVVISPDGQIVDMSYAPLSVSRPRPNWSEQAPDDWWIATQEAVLKLSPVVREGIHGVGLSGQMHGATLLDESDAPLRPAILWNDGRSDKECADLERECPDFLEKAGNLVMPGFTAPKLEWVRRHEPKIFSAVARVLLPKDYVRLCLTGEYASDMSDSAGTLWLDIAKRDWHEPLLNACGLTRKQMPDLYEGTQQTGQLRQELASSWGMNCVAVFAGGGDNAAGAAGVGVIDHGEALVSLGTSGVIFVATDAFRSNPKSGVHAFCHALPSRWHVMSVMLSAASCLDWACRLTRTGDVSELIELAATTAETSPAELFLPYLSGERTPHNNTDARGVFFGITHDTGPAELAQAVLEGVAFGLADGLDALLNTGVGVDELTVIGGGARSSYWGSVLSSALGYPLVYRDGGDIGPALGAARIAAYGTKGGDPGTAFSPPEITGESLPDPRLRQRYVDQRERFSNLYSQLKPSFIGASNV